MSQSRKSSWMGTYKETIEICCNPDCETQYERKEVHHIVPVKQGGDEGFSNYIVLCVKCHNFGNKHGRWYEWKEKLYRWKFYQELLIIGQASDEYTNSEYKHVLRAARKAKRKAEG